MKCKMIKGNACHGLKTIPATTCSKTTIDDESGELRPLCCKMCNYFECCNTSCQSSHAEKQKVGNCKTGMFSGASFGFENPDPKDVTLEDIAHHLSNICRFTGGTSQFFSVGQHSLNVSAHLQVLRQSPYVQLIGLLHDASEAYMSDVSRPLKLLLKEYVKIEELVQNTIYKAFGVYPIDNLTHQLVKEADNDCLAAEAKMFMRGSEAWGLKGRPVILTYLGWTPYYIELNFKKKVKQLLTEINVEKSNIV